MTTDELIDLVLHVVVVYVLTGLIMSALLQWRSRTAVDRSGKVLFVGIVLLWPVVVAIIAFILWDERSWAKKVKRGKWW